MAKATGNWSSDGASGIWYTNATGGIVDTDYTTRTASTEAPTAANSDGIIIYNNFTVTVTAGGFEIDETTVNTGASIIVNSGQTLTIANGTGDDLTNAGTLLINSGAVVDSNGTFRSTGTVSFDGAGDVDNGTLQIADSAATFGTLIEGSGTINYDGTDQTIVADTYYNLTLSGSSGTKTAAGSITATALTVNDGAYNVALNGGCTITDAVTFANTGTTTIGNESGDSSIFTDGLNATAGAVNIAGTVATTNTAMDLGATTQTAASTIKSGSGAITVASMTGDYDLTLQENEGTSTGGVTFTGNLAANDLITFGRGYAVTLQGSVNVIDNDTSFLNTGTVTLGNEDTDILTFNGGLETSGNNSNPSSTIIHGSIVTSNDALVFGTTTVSGNTTLNTAEGTITLGAVTINDGKTLTVGTGNTGTISFSSTVKSAVDGTGNLIINTDDTATLSDDVGGDSKSLNTITLTSGNLATGNKNITASMLDINGGTFGSGIAPSGDWDIGTVDIANSATLNATSGTFTVSGDWTNAGIFADNDGTIDFDGGSTSTLTSGGSSANQDFYTISITNGTTLKAATNGVKAAIVNVISGTLDMATNDQALEVTDTLTIAADQNYYTGTGQQTIGTMDNSGNVTIEGDKDNVAITTMTNNDGSLWTYTKDSGTVKVIEGTYHDLTFNDGGGTADYTLQANTNVTGVLTVTGGTVSVNNFKFDVTETAVNNDIIDVGTGELEVTGNITNNGTITISTGTLDANANLDAGTLTASGAANIEVAGNWSGVDVFTASTSTVMLNGSSEQSITSGGFEFNKLTLNNSAGAALADNTTVSNQLALTTGLLTLGTNNLIISSNFSRSCYQGQWNSSN